jgi:hypothetical protein
MPRADFKRDITKWPDCTWPKWRNHACKDTDGQMNVKMAVETNVLYYDHYTSDVRYPIQYCPYCGTHKSLIAEEVGEVYARL